MHLCETGHSSVRQSGVSLGLRGRKKPRKPKSTEEQWPVLQVALKDLHAHYLKNDSIIFEI